METYWKGRILQVWGVILQPVKCCMEAEPLFTHQPCSIWYLTSVLDYVEIIYSS